MLMTVAFVAGAVFASQAQNTVSGKLFPTGSETPVYGAEVYVGNSQDAIARTDHNGYFNVEVAEDAELRIEYPGYKTVYVSADKNKDVLLHLETNPEKDELVNAYGKSVKVQASLNPQSRDGILVLESEDQQFKYWFDTRVYFDGAAYFGDNEEIGNGVNIRRARFAMKTILYGHWGGEFDIDLAYNEVDLKDAYIRYIGNKWQIKAGNFKEPLSMERTTTSRYLTFIERPMIAELAPSRHMGIAFRSWGQRYYFEGGVFSSEIANGLMQDENKSNGTNSGFSTTARFAFTPIKKDKQVLHLGIAGSYRTPKIPEIGDPESSFRFNTRAETSINRKKYLDTDWVEHADFMTLAGAEIAFAHKNIKVSGEFIRGCIRRDKNEVPEGEDKAVIQGFFAGAGWLVNNANYFYNMSEAEFSQIDFIDPHKGVFEIAARYDYTDANTFKDDAKVPYIQGGAAEAYTLGLNYYLNYNVKLMLNYSYVNNDRWADGKGKYDVDKTLPDGESGIDFHMIQARIEIDF